MRTASARARADRAALVHTCDPPCETRGMCVWIDSCLVVWLMGPVAVDDVLYEN